MSRPPMSGRRHGYAIFRKRIARLEDDLSRARECVDELIEENTDLRWRLRWADQLFYQWIARWCQATGKGLRVFR